MELLQKIFTNATGSFFALLASIYIAYKTFPKRKRNQVQNTFFSYVWSLALFSIISFLVILNDEHIFFNAQVSASVLNILYFLTLMTFLFHWFLYEEAVIPTIVTDKYWKKALWTAPVFIFMILCIVSLKTKFLFYIDENGTYYRGEGYWVQFLFTYFYLIVVMVKTVFNMFKHEIPISTRKALALNTAILFVGVLFQLLFLSGYIALFGAFGLVISFVELYTIEENEAQKKEEMAALLAQTKRQKELLQEALDNYKQADYDRRTDFLTGLRNRQDMYEVLSDELSGKRSQINAMFMIDIDRFKQLNDHYGHTYGDKCLQVIGRALKAYGMDNQIDFYRYGGEEILGMSYNTRKNARIIAIELVVLIQNLSLKRDDSETGFVSISLGYTTDTSDLDKMVDKADQAMYHAKDYGRNRYACYEDMNNRR